MEMQSVLQLCKEGRDMKRSSKSKFSGSVPTLEHLRRELRQAFADEHVNVEYVQDIMSSYKSNVADWKKFAKFNRHRYTRNLVDEGNGKFNLMILCWSEGQSSAIHDHSDAHCFMKMLQGSLRETRYSWPEEGSEDELQETGTTTLDLNDVCYINDSLGIHRVENTSHTDRAVSLHLYCPPFNSCTVFNNTTGHRTTCPVTFWSIYGEKYHAKVYRGESCPEDS